MTIKPDKAAIIRKGMLPSFLNELQACKVGKEYWDECFESKNTFSSSDIEEMKEMCNNEKN